LDISYFKLNEEGLHHFFGPLEASVMEVLWSMPSNEATNKEVHTRISKDQDLSINTIMTVLNRLAEKGHLIKVPINKKSAVFKTRHSKDEFVQKQTGAVTDMLFRDFGDYAVHHMINALEEADMQVLAKLERKLKELKSKRESL
jgi:predicted transcriptional regulator